MATCEIRIDYGEHIIILILLLSQNGILTTYGALNSVEYQPRKS